MKLGGTLKPANTGRECNAGLFSKVEAECRKTRMGSVVPRGWKSPGDRKGKEWSIYQTQEAEGLSRGALYSN